MKKISLFLLVLSVILLSGTIYAQCTITTFPYTEDFDTVTSPNFPCDWVVTNDNSDNQEWIIFGAGAFSNPNAVAIDYNLDGVTAMDDWLFSPGLQLQAGTTYELQFYYKAADAGFPESLEVQLGTGQSAADMNTVIFNNASITNTTYQLATQQFTAPSSGIFHLGFHGYSPANRFRLFVDDISVSELSSTCPNPSGLASTNFTSTSADIKWASTGTEFIVEYGPVGFNLGEGTQITGITDTFTSINSLSADTAYDVYVRQICGIGDSSTFTGPETFVLNDSCIYAIPAACNSPITGTTIGANLNISTSNCGVPINTPGVWYTFTGTGNTISASTCSPDTDFDTRISVFSGTCGSLSCVGGNDDFGGCANNVNFSKVDWNSTVGQTYYILVHGFDGATGNFTLTVNAQGVANAGQDQTICLGDTTTLTASGGAQYSWSTGASNASIDVAPLSTSNYFVTVTTANGCVDSDTVTVFATDSTDGGTVLAENGLDTISICVDGNPDIIQFDSTNNATSGANYSYIITDAANTTVLAVPGQDEAEFEQFGAVETHVWGVSHVGNLNVNVGQSVSNITADVCFELSSNYIVVFGDSVNAGTDIQVLDNGAPVDSIQICIDNDADSLNFTNNGGAGPNSSYAYVATDANDLILGTFSQGADFNQAGVGLAKVYGVSYIGSLTATAGQPLNTLTASVCFEISSDFVAVSKDSIDGGTVSLQNGNTSIDVCLGSGNTTIQLDSNTQATSGADYTYIATDVSNATVLAVLPGDFIDVVGAQPGEYHLWGISSIGNLSIPSTPTPLSSVSADKCFELSSNFITVIIDSAAVTAVPDQTICEGDTTVLTASGNGTFEWSTGATQNSISVSPVQTTSYRVTITNSNNCQATDTVVVNVNPAPTVNLTNPNICPGSSTTLDAGNAGATYAWSTGESTQTITVSAQGDYSVTVTDANTCSAADTATLSFGAGLNVSLSDQAICQGDTAFLDAGFSGSTYTWSNGATSQVVAITTAGDYSVTVEDATGCTGADTATISVNSLPNADAGTDQNICEGSSATLTASGGASYAWSSGASSATTTVSPTQTTSYTVTVTDGNNCSATDDVLVNVNSNPIINLPDPSICAGSSTILDAGNPGATYSWSTGASTQTITVSSAGDYSVTVTNANNCTSADTATVTVGSSLTVDLGGDYDLCQGESVVLDAENPGSTYAWSNGSSSQTITVTSANNYSVTVTDANNCTGSDTSLVNVNSLPVADAGQDQQVCQGENTTLTASGGVSYEWSTGGTTASITVNPTQTTTYNVTVTDANNCTATDDVNVSALPVPSVNLPDPSICPGSSTTLDAGNPGATYTWSTGESTQSIAVSTPGDYIVVVTENGCSSTDTATVSNSSSLVVDLGGDYDLCQGDNQVLDAGNPGSTYQWSTGDNTQTITVSSSDEYSVTVTDANNCSGSDTSVVTVNPLPSADAGVDQTICMGESASLSASGGTSYDWSNNQSGTSISVSPMSTTTYSVTVTDANNCSATDDIEVAVNALPVVNIPDASFCAGDSTSLDAGNTGASYAWSTGETSQTISVSTVGTYSVTVTNANNCSTADTSEVTQGNNLTVNLGSPQACQGDTVILDAANAGASYLWTTGDTTRTIAVTADGNYGVTVAKGSCTGSDNVQLTFQTAPNAIVSNDTSICLGENVVLTASGGTSYNWSNGGNTSSITVSPTSATNYSVTVSNANNCTDIADVDVTVSAPSTAASAVSTNNNNFCAGGSATLTVSGGSLGAGAQWAWYESSCGGNSIGLGAAIVVNPTANTNYFVRAEGACDTSACASILLTVLSLPNADAGVNDTICPGESSTLTATGGASYFWSNNETTASITVTPSSSTNYNVTVTGANNCTASDDVLVFVNPAPTANAGSDEEICAGESVTLTATGGASYSWSNGTQSSDNIVSPSANTEYIVTVQNVQGCEDNDTVAVSINALPAVDFQYNGRTLCESDDPITLNATPSNGTFSGNGISGNQFVPSLADIGDNILSYSFTDNNNCTATDSDTIEVAICPGIEEVSNISVTEVFPNPFNAFIQLDFKALSQEDVRISLVDIAGKTIVTKNFELVPGNQSIRLNTSDVVSNGVYLLTIESEREREVIRLVKAN